MPLDIDASFYAALAYRVHSGRLPLGWAAVLLNAGWALAFIFLGAAVVLFPDGRLPSQHWRWPWRIYLAVSAVWTSGGVVILVTVIAGHHVQVDSSGDLSVPAVKEGHELRAGGPYGITRHPIFTPGSWACWPAPCWLPAADGGSRDSPCSSSSSRSRSGSRNG
jgi:protein-S-isoprenylcysteine O-methyltransferase Ste14